MQDRFKSRVYDKAVKRYLTDNDVYEITDGILDTLYDLLNDENRNFVLGRHDLIFEQCTGLKDKNGKLIYEGDVVSLVPEIEKIRYVVKWDEYNAQLFLDGLNKRVRIDFNTIDLKLEVVGNIHENPELLEATND